MGRRLRILSDLGGTVRGSQSPFIEFRNKAFTGGRSFLTKTSFDADPLCKSQYPVVFFRRYSTIQRLNVRYLWQRCILIHNADINMISIGLMEIAQDFFGRSRWRTIIPCCINQVSSSMTGSPTWRNISEMAAQAVSK